MTRGKGRHLRKESREVIEEGVRRGNSVRKISKAIGASASTVTREMRANRTARDTRGSAGRIRILSAERMSELERISADGEVVWPPEEAASRARLVAWSRWSNSWTKRKGTSRYSLSPNL